MINRPRNLPAFMARGENWARRLFLSNLALALALTALYLFNITIPPFRGFRLPEPLAILTGYLIVFLLVWMLDYVLADYRWLPNAYNNRGLRLSDLASALLGAVILLVCWRIRLVNLPILAVGILVSANGLLGLWRVGAAYSEQVLEYVRDQAPNPGLQPEDDLPDGQAEPPPETLQEAPPTEEI